MDTKLGLRHRDVYNTGRSEYGFPKLNPFPDMIVINNFNASLTDVLVNFCINKNYYYSIVADRCFIIKTPQEEYEKYIEQLKLFYL